MNVKGIHHLTAMTGSAAHNFKFYTEVLGMRLVKKTVNQDDTTAYHLFYGDEQGNPGTELTFFDFPNAGPKRAGVSSISNSSLRVASNDALKYWIERFTEFNVKHEPISEFAGRNVIFFEDAEGQQLTLVSDETNTVAATGTPWDKSLVPVEYGITGLGPVRLTVRTPEPTIAALQILGFTEKNRVPALVEGQDDIIVMEVGEGGTGAEVFVEPRTDLPAEVQGIGGVHHVAFRVDDEEELHAWIDKINSTRLPNSGICRTILFHFFIFPRAKWHPIRTCNRWAWIRNR